MSKFTHLTLITFEYIINLECDFMDKYNIEEIKEKLERCKSMELEDVTLDDVDEISFIKIDRRKSSNEKNIRFFD